MSSKRAFVGVTVAFGMLLNAATSGAVTEAKPTDLSTECISPDAAKALSECPAGKMADVHSKRPAAFSSAPPPRDVKKRQDDSKPVNPEEMTKLAERDTRKNRLQARARALLITEIQGLERLYKRTPKKSPDRPQLVRRLAEGYVELESAAQRDKIAADISAQDAKRKKQDASKFRSDAAAADKILAAARKSAISYYTLMKTDYPDYSKIDEVLYYLAYEYEQGGDLKNARATYFELIQKAPKSAYIPNAYLAFGELFFQEAQGDPSKWELSAAAYKEVIKYPPPNNKVYGYARYKLGYVFWNKGEYANALNEFKKVIEYGDTYADLPTAKLLAETAMSWHLEAVGSGGVRGTGDKKTMDLAAYLYKKVADNFTSADFAKFEFPRIVKTDWPTMYKIKYAMADLLYFQQRWEECGPAFDAVVVEDPKNEQAAEAAYASVLCYQKMYDQMYKGATDRKGKGLGPQGADEKDREAKKGEWEKFKPKPLTDMQKGMVNAFNRYVCYVKPQKDDKDAQEQYVEVKYGRARIYFEAQHWEEAALAFRDVAINHADRDAGIYAAQLYLESINVLGARAEPPRPQCFDEMAKDVPTFLELYCKGAKAEDNKEQCETLNRIQFDIRRLKAQKQIELADQLQDKGDYKNALDNYKKGADSYLDLWRSYCEEPLGKGEHPKQCEKADEIVYNMARGYQAARLLAKSIQARLILLSSRYGLADSPLAMKATYEIGGNY